MENEYKDLDLEEKYSYRSETSYQAWIKRCEGIWSESAKRLTLSMRYLYFAISGFLKRADGRFAFTATDGETIFYNPLKISGAYERGVVYVNRAYMHIIMHCIFPAVRKAGSVNKEDRLLWDLASDIHAEYILDGINLEEILLPESDLKIRIYRYLTLKCGILSIENIFNCLKDEKESDIADWRELFYSDDHSLWAQADEKSNKNWEQRSRQVLSALSASGIGKSEERLVKSLRLSQKKIISYEEFLRGFMSIHEKNHIDPESFDYAYYTYGLELYKDMPLIEETEGREESLLEDFFIVIDTSGSCANGQIKKFLEETQALLSLEKRFLEGARVRLLQCDKEVLSDILLRPGESAAKQIQSANVKGFGGTDFRPAFKYIRENVTDLSRVSGMLYFTDGYGIYPSTKPPWKTAFIFVKEPDFEDEERMRSIAAFAAEEKTQVALRPPAWALTHVIK